MSEGNSLDDLMRRARLVEVVGKQAWSQVLATFPGQWFERWTSGLATLIDAGYAQAAVLAYARVTPVVANRFGPEVALRLAPAVVTLGKTAGRRAGLGLLSAAADAARRVPDADAFSLFLSVVDDLGRQAPESVVTVLDRTDNILSTLTAGGFRRWAMAGIRLHPTDEAERRAYFSLSAGDTLRIFDQESGTVVFGDVERRLKIFIEALWGIRPLVRSAARRSATKPIRRTGFDGGMVRMPESFPGFSRDSSERLFKASIAHVGAHMRFSTRFELRTLKPLQVAIISLIEDARVEQLAMRDLPGLLRLWAPFHVAEPSGPASALPLLARLSRSLIDPAFVDDNPWVEKGRKMFFDSRAEWEDQETSRRIGGLLGNDLGQMRIQFNPRTYVVQPPYRDDNMGIWDFGRHEEADSEDLEIFTESVRISQTEEDTPHDRTRTEQDGGANQTARIIAVDENVGIPVARHPEWDYVLGAQRIDWTTVLEYEPRRASSTVIDRIYREHSDVLAQVGRLVRSARVSKPARLRRQGEGDRLDLDACVRVAIDRRAGIEPDPRVYETSALVNRDLSILVLIDISESTKDLVAGTATSVFSIERAATALLAEAMSESGDPFAIHAFCSNGRSDIRYYRVKDFKAPFGDLAKARLAGLRGGYSTRLGAAIRHAGADLHGQQTHRRLLLIVTDGEPSDIDVTERRYLVEDARHAVHELARAGIDVFCVGLDSGGDTYLTRIFGRRNVVQIDRVTALPERLPMLYFRLTH
jgi:hypothetical protein